ncbi:hypothetical protein J6590_069859 [Homalodisca vitripennis]|nr:hypothetical protein J6590_069859 [Homalodisca vitripennis]
MKRNKREVNLTKEDTKGLMEAERSRREWWRGAYITLSRLISQFKWPPPSPTLLSHNSLVFPSSHTRRFV